MRRIPMQSGRGQKERVNGIAGLWGMEKIREGRRKQKHQIRRRWQREVELELALRENEVPQDAH